MSWVRCAVIAKQEMKVDILETLKEYHEPELIAECDGMALFIYEGRHVADLDRETTLTIGIDGRSILYYIRGNNDLALAFEAYIELTVGFAIHLSDKAKLERNAEAKNILNEISNHKHEDRQNEENDIYGCRFDVRLGKESADLQKCLKELAAVCGDLGIGYLVVLFDGEWGHELGDLIYDYRDLYIGPLACACFEWKDGCLFINHDEMQL